MGGRGDEGVAWNRRRVGESGNVRAARPGVSLPSSSSSSVTRENMVSTSWLSVYSAKLWRRCDAWSIMPMRKQHCHAGRERERGGGGGTRTNLHKGVNQTHHHAKT